MKKSFRYLEHFLKQTVYLLPYLLMGVSFLSIILPKLGFSFNYVTWGNAGGFSIITDIMFITFLSFDNRYCRLTRFLPFSLLLINIVNIISNQLPDKYREYEQLYEIIIFSLTLFIALVICINKRINR